MRSKQQTFTVEFFANMPHSDHESPVMVACKTAAPSPDDVAHTTQTIYGSKTSQESLDAAYALTDMLLNSVGFRGLTAYNVVPEIQKMATNKKDVGKREGAMFALGAIFERFPPKARLSEVVFLLKDLHFLSKTRSEAQCQLVLVHTSMG